MRDKILKALKDNRITIVNISSDLGISRQAFYKKLNGKISFSQKELRVLARNTGFYVRELKKHYEVR